MPEIAEVALMMGSLRDILLGKKLTKLTVLGGRYLVYKIKTAEGHWVEKVEEKVVTNEGIEELITVKVDPSKYPGGQYFTILENYETLSGLFPYKITSVNVKGKYGWIELENNWYIGITFGMSGGIYYEPTDDVISEYNKTSKKKPIGKQEYMKHFHIKFETDDHSCAYFGDPRRFGTITLSNDRKKLNKKLSSLGADMLTGEQITDDQFVKIFRSSSFCDKNICVVLMGQKAISGVGNYIKAEVLYECGISPWALILDIDDSTLIKLHQAIRQIAQKAFVGKGASLYTYKGTRNEKGTFQEMLKVYGKTIDPKGNKVCIIDEDKSPDKRTTHYVKEVQLIGSHRSKIDTDTETPSKVQQKQTEIKKIPIKLKIKLKSSTINATKS